MLVGVIRSSGLHALLRNAARIAGTESCIVQPRALPDHLRCHHDEPPIVVHDFLPAPRESIDWLNYAASRHRTLAVFALLEVPATPTLHALARASHRFTLCGMARVREQDAASLAARFRDARSLVCGQELLALVRTAWRLDPVLARLAERYLSLPRPPATLEGLLRGSGVGRKRFVHCARAAGFVPPLRFLHGLRVLSAESLLQRGLTVEEAARRLGYGSCDTMRTHFREAAGITAATARHLSLPDFVERMATRTVHWPRRSTASRT
jgi:AraC-like DNA-binding protein